MKVGIMTFHAIINYGSALQAYAMQEGIAGCGVETELIDYQPQGDASFLGRLRNNWKNLLNWRKWRRYLTNKVSARRDYYVDAEKASRRAERFYAFQKEQFRLSEKITDRNALPGLQDAYDAFACGSDQVWNPTYIGHDLSYYLDFVQDAAKRIAYAPSIAVKEISREYADEIRDQMEKFQRISVREEESVQIVRQMTGKDAIVVVDPTLLLEQESWQKIERAPSDEYTKEPYIFCYFLGPNKEYCKYVNRLKELTGQRVLVVTCTELKAFRGYGDIICDDIGPAEFVYLIHHADYVCTDSFHGTVFSIIHKRNFFTFKRYRDGSKSSENSRIYTLLNMIGCPERLVGAAAEIERLYRSHPDYSKIDERILHCKKASIDFLREELDRVRRRRTA